MLDVEGARKEPREAIVVLISSSLSSSYPEDHAGKHSNI